MKKLILKAIEVYQKYLSFDRGLFAILAPGGACKYNPSCSEYTKQMVARFGVMEGISLGIKRVWSCR